MIDNVRILTGGNVEFDSVDAAINLIEVSMNTVMIDAINDIDTSDNSLDLAMYSRSFVSILGSTGSIISVIAARVDNMYGENATKEEVRSVVDSVYEDADSTAYSTRLAAAKQYLIDVGEYNRGQLESDDDMLDMLANHTTAIMANEASDDAFKDEIASNYMTTIEAGYTYEQFSEGYENLYKNLGIITNFEYSFELNNACKSSVVTVVVGDAD